MKKNLIEVKNKLKIINTHHNCKNFILAIETDLNPLSIKNLLNEKKLKGLGLLLDTGNAASNGYKLKIINFFPEKNNFVTLLKTE